MERSGWGWGCVPKVEAVVPVWKVEGRKEGPSSHGFEGAEVEWEFKEPTQLSRPKVAVII